MVLASDYQMCIHAHHKQKHVPTHTVYAYTT